MAVALWRAVAVVYACGLVVARAGTDPRGEAFLGGKGRCGRADFGNDLVVRQISTSPPNLVAVTMLQASPQTIHFKRLFNFGEGQGIHVSCNSRRRP